MTEFQNYGDAENGVPLLNLICRGGGGGGGCGGGGGV